ncbi:GH3 domain-containing protein-like [Mercenaria mercenaria]|uniref:GH3 domain-containing protein-like n=1 Tax=Mercenaria mercenaria TaxID=6596 RepID=UPI00234F8A31|nr:GH3 domain-containing protein-like [Mercenaria mercenaria]XP_053398737.1 GH3 domain-containing protein-like [Mercenaria mercenaria]
MVFSAVDRYITVSGVSWLGWYMRRKLEDSTKDVKAAQHETLMERIKENADTEYGQRFMFKDIKGRDDFIKFHPLTRYPHYEPYIDRMMKGEMNILTKDQPVIFAVTSGTSGKSSVLPMLKKQQGTFFTQGIAIIYDCMRNAFPETGSQQKDMKFFYTPRLRTSECGIPVGPNSSSPANSKRILSMYSTPKAGYDILSEPEALYIHLLFGLKDKNLGIIEANFASLVYSAFRALDTNWDSLVTDIEKGNVSDGIEIEESVRKELNKSMSPDPKRAAELREAREQGVTGLAHRVWPKLNFVMTADSGTFELYGNRLREIYCKGTPIYSPLYAASEGLLGINIWPKERPSRYLLAPRSMFFEFIPVQNCEEEQPKTLFLDEVEVDQVYELVITNASGLYRYRFGDVVKVVGHHNTCPVIEFQYRQGQFLNVRGEKTSENYFYQAVNSAILKSGLNMVDYCCTESLMVDQVSKDKPAAAPCYHVFIELEKDEKVTAKVQIDEELKALSYVYASFRRKGSIGPMKVYIVKPGTFAELRSFMIETTTGSPNQYKVPRVLKKPEAVKFIMDKIDVCLL